ncbi:MAG: sortase [Ruminococcus sp.]|nr:sortase [Ruminococcus sp.]
MNKRRGRTFIAMGTLLLLVAMSLILLNLLDDHNATKRADEILDTLSEEIGVTTQQSIEIDGYDYIGIVSIPSLGVELPVQSGWDHGNLKLAACRFDGTADSGDLIIAAHSYTAFFKSIDKLNSGDEVYYTELDGTTKAYEVQWSELINDSDDDMMLDGSDDWDLTLFTYTWSGSQRVTVRCVEISK